MIKAGTMSSFAISTLQNRAWITERDRIRVFVGWKKHRSINLCNSAKKPLSAF